MGKILSLNNAPANRENAPVSVKSGVVLHPLSDYGKTTNEGCELPRFAPFCKKCSKTRALIFKLEVRKTCQNTAFSGILRKE